jgi:hypothetical protein
MTTARTRGCPIVREDAAKWGDAHRYPCGMSIIRSVSTSLAHEAARLARDVPGAVARARMEGERKVLARRHRNALQALGARAFALSRDGHLTAEALAPEIADVETLLALVEASERAEPADGTAHDAAVAFPMLADDTTA